MKTANKRMTSISNSVRRLKTMALHALALLIISGAVACSDDNSPSDPPGPTPIDPYPAPVARTNNKAEFIKDKEKRAMLYSMEDLDGTGRLYEVNYTADYKLDAALEAGISSTPELLTFVQQNLFDSLPASPSPVKFSLQPGCSAFASPDPSTNNYLMGRNYDFCHTVQVDSATKRYVPIAAFVVHTAPKGGKKSVAFADGYNFGYKQGAYTDDTTDISLLIGLPYAILDGINEDGFAIGVLSLNEAPTMQDDPNKTNIGTTIAMRMLLDRASTVKEAIEMLKQYNMRMKNLDNKHNYHFFMADATGDYAIVEYTRNPKDSTETNPTRMEVFTNNDTLRCVTNFYVSPNMVGTKDGWGSDHGKQRYFDMRDALKANNYALCADDAMALLEQVSQEANEDDPTSFTQWSALYNLSKKSVCLTLLRDYGKEFYFRVFFRPSGGIE